MYPPIDVTPTGKGIGIAFLDTGISPVADFTHPQNRVVAFRDFIDGKNKPYDNNGHGTHLTGGIFVGRGSTPSRCFPSPPVINSKSPMPFPSPRCFPRFPLSTLNHQYRFHPPLFVGEGFHPLP